MVEYDPQEKELVKRLDWKLIPILSIYYFCLLMVLKSNQNRSNQIHTSLPNWKSEELLKKYLDIDIDSSILWSIATHSIASVIFVLPSTLLFRKIGPSLWFSLSLGIWGIAVIASSMINSYGWYIFFKLVLGIAQAGYFPLIRFMSCVITYIVSFYTKEESATRFTYVFGGASVVEAFFELLSNSASRADSQMDLSGWQWVFVLEGLVMIVLGIFTYIYLPSFPETCKFLNAADRVLAVARGKDGYDQEGSSLVTKTTHVNTRTPEFRFQKLEFLEAVNDIRVWILSVCFLFLYSSIDYMSILVPEVTADTFGLGIPCLVNCTIDQQGHVSLSDGISLVLFLLCLIPYLISFGISVYVANKSDSTGDRITFVAAFLSSAMIGFFVMAITHHTSPVRYFFGILPIVIGLTCSVPFILSAAMDWAVGDTQRATVSSILVAFGNSFGLLITSLQQLTHHSEYVSQPIKCWISLIFVGIALGCVGLVYYLQQREQQDSWGKAPGLRRLLNDAEESKAWDVELNNLDYLKSQPVEFGYDSMGKSWESAEEI